LLKTDAGIRNRDAVRQGLTNREVLTTRVQVAFNHQTKNAMITRSDLRCNVMCYVDLLGVLLAAVGV